MLVAHAVITRFRTYRSLDLGHRTRHCLERDGFEAEQQPYSSS
jgi:hypothetical protein